MAIKTDEAKEENLYDLLEIENEVFGLETKSSIEHALKVESFKYFLAQFDSNNVGFIAISCLGDEGEILSLAVKSKFRRKGIGEKLIKVALNYFSSCGIKNIFLEVAVSNVAAQKLYTKTGFKEIYRRKNYYKHKNADSEDAVVMKIEL